MKYTLISVFVGLALVTVIPPKAVGQTSDDEVRPNISEYIARAQERRLSNLRLAAEQGDPDAQFNLANKYYSGSGKVHDYAEALKWYHRAAEQGYSDAQYNLGAIYINGVGVAQDKVRAHMWLNIAATNGDINAGTARDLIASKMRPVDITRAQKLARECIARNLKGC